MHLDPTIITYITLALIVFLLLWIVRLEVKLRRLFMGTNAQSFEETIGRIKKEMDEFKVFRIDAEHYLESVEKRLRNSIQASETIRFNPWKGGGVGGNQSFATSFVNEKGDGVVISSLNRNDHVSIFSKPLKAFGSEFELTEEEKEVILKSKESIKGKN